MLRSRTLSSRNRRALIIATIILLFAAYLRLYKLDFAPPGIAYDEGQVVWDTIRVSRWGWFPAYNDTRAEPLARYLTAVLVAVAGRTIFTARMMSVFWGMLSVALAYRATMSLFWRDRERRVAALFAAALIAVISNAVTLTRFADRGTFMVVVMMAGVHFLIMAWRTKRPWFWALTGFFWMGAVHTYTAALFFPLGLIGILAHQAIFNFGEFRERLRGLLFMLLGAVPPLAWWLWQFSRPGPLYWRGTEVGAWQYEPVRFFTIELPRRLWQTTVGFYLYGDCDPQFNVWDKPLLNPALFALALVGLVLIVMRFRRLEAGTLLVLLPVQLLPIALTVDVVHGRRIAGEWLIVAAFAGLTVMAIWRWLARQKFAAWARPVFALALTGLLTATGIDAALSFVSYVTSEIPHECDMGPIDPYVLYLHDHIELAELLREVDVPTYVPLEEMDVPAVHVVVSQGFPKVEPYSTFAAPEEGLNLPDGQVIIWPGMEANADYVLLMPGRRFGRGTVILLPGLSPTNRFELERALINDAEPIPGARSPQIARRLTLDGDFNPFADMRAPELSEIATYGDHMRLMRVDAPFIITPGETAFITLHWQATRRLPEDYYTSVTLVDAAGEAFANDYYWIMRWVYATAQWRPGETVPDGHDLTIPADLAPGAYRLRVGVAAEWSDPAPLEAVGPNGEPLGTFVPLDYVKVPLPEPPPMPADAVATDIMLGGAALDGYTVTRGGRAVTLDHVRAGDTITITLYWRAEDRLPGQYHLFIHVQEDADREVLAGFDGPPLGDTYPTIVWGPHERLVTTHTISVPEGIESPEFRIGLYEWPSLARLPAMQDGTRMDDDRAILWSPE